MIEEVLHALFYPIVAGPTGREEPVPRGRRLRRVLRVRTESGSVYDVDHEGMRIRRVHGRHGPADTQPQDGIWRRISGLEGPTAGASMVVYWATEVVGPKETDYGFRTTLVTEVSEVEPDAAP
jgi:hypothetical protein